MSLIQNIRKTINYSKKNGYTETVIAAWERVTARYYADYKYVLPQEDKLHKQREDKTLSDIKFSILVPAYETGEKYLEALVDSCIAQTYGKWELIIADGSATDIVRKTLDKYRDKRIKYVKLDKNGGIADNTNKAIEMACGDYCGLLDHDDMLTPDALYEMARKISHAKYAPVMVYSDEDKCDSEGKNFYDPHFKKDFNLDLLLTNNYICHFLVIKTELIKKLGIRREYDGSQDFDLILRVVSNLLLKEKEGQLNKETGMIDDLILHVPKILYHWRCHQNSTADNPQSKMYAYEAGKKALIDFSKRMGWKVDVRHNKHLGFYRIIYRNNVLVHRPDLAAVGGYIVRNGKIINGEYAKKPLLYAGYMNRMDLYQNTDILDIRNLAVNKAYQPIYEKVTGHHYENTFASDSNEMPKWIEELNRTKQGREKIERLNAELSRQLRKDKIRLLLDPESVRKI
ncbi:MAG: glycosyltransferase [Lachnospiraceae bacterium]|nr:glycosyltransferase [Lachnospiraceae bacterium]MEE0920142.1 glycosyltransferase [Lachnospiraceae bacterium]